MLRATVAATGPIDVVGTGAADGLWQVDRSEDGGISVTYHDELTRAEGVLGLHIHEMEPSGKASVGSYMPRQEGLGY